MELSNKDFQDAAKILNCSVAAIKAVAEVESRGGGFNSDGTPKILFEGHWFWRLTKGKYGRTYFSYPKWIRTYYNIDQHKRLHSAAQKDREAALMSASWGVFQIMGFNYKKCGFNSVQDFVNAMYKSEREHLLAFCNFIKSKGLADELQNLEWAKFAFSYNGPGFRKNKYHTKLSKAYKKHSSCEYNKSLIA